MSDDGKKDQDESDVNTENEDDTLSYYHKSTIYIPAVTQTSTSMNTEAEPKKDHKETVYIDNRLVREKKNVFSYSSVNDFVEKNIKLIDTIQGTDNDLESLFYKVRLHQKGSFGSRIFDRGLKLAAHQNYPPAASFNHDRRFFIPRGPLMQPHFIEQTIKM